MKKKSKIILGIILLIIIAIIAIFIINLQKNNEGIQSKNYNEAYNEDYYTITYSTNYDNAKILDAEQEYVVLTERRRLDEI